MTSGGTFKPAYNEWILAIIRAQACMMAEHGLFEMGKMGAICVTVSMSVPSKSYTIMYRRPIRTGGMLCDHHCILAILPEDDQA